VHGEREAFDRAIASLRRRAKVLTIDYDNFSVSARGFDAWGLNNTQIHAIVSGLRK
jgi:hypothetical protein